ncbi:uncharacterized protein LOC133187811 [Saccostrea echinata]|uniref:uncharacterized protein LOC133187811 n=1 Tax=Saccostrea echinata TaxID=191078 RepID=UPI002A82169A|nr:uncharacterized protein LOC133187811 [Saccostrea echinata]
MAGRRQTRTQSEGDVIGMSEEALLSTSIKNELEKWKLMNEMHTLVCGEKQCSMENSRKLRKLKEDITKMLAEGCVYKLHGFKKYDPFLSNFREKENMEEGLKPKALIKSLSTGTFPSISETGNYVKTNIKSYERKVDKKDSDISPATIPNTLTNIDLPDISSHFEENNEENEEFAPCTDLLSSLSNSFHGMIMWRQKIRDRIIEKEKAKVDPPVRYHPKVETKNINRYKHMFAGNCRTYYAMKKFVDKEAEIMINKVDSPLYYKKISELEKLKQKCKIPEIIRRDKSTSAIFRDFENYKAQKVQEKKRKVSEWQTSQ